MWKLSDILLGEKTRETNITYSHSDFINAETYPEQIVELLGTKIDIPYNTQYRCNIKDVLENPAIKVVDGEIVSLRPDDDYQFIENREITGTDTIDAVDVRIQGFTVLRVDKTEPNVFIAISNDYDTVVVSSTKINEMGHYTFLDQPSIYPVQYNEFFGLRLLSHYMNDSFIDDVYYDCMALRVDKTEPCLTVLVEFLPDNRMRFVLGDEVTGIDNDTFDPENYISDQEISIYRQSILGDRIIYGVDENNNQ